MKNKLLFLSFLILLSFFFVKDTYAFDQNTYASRTLCGNFEVALFKSDGTIETRSCHSNYDAAFEAMTKDGNRDLAIIGKWEGKNKIYSANAALVDLTHSPGVFYIYSNSQITDNTAYTYMVGSSAYGGVDAAFLSVAYSTAVNTFSMRIKVSGYTGWVRLGAFEIVPLVWVKSASSYTISNESIRHNYVTKIQNQYTSASGNTIGPKPDNIPNGTYFSYDGHYFYTDLYELTHDYKLGIYSNAINKDNPYYNYYQFLPQHTKTTYSSINIDEYTRNQMNFKQDVYGNSSSSAAGYRTSRLYGKGAFFYNAQELYGENALLAYGVSRNESGNGTSNLSINKNNGFGLNAVDSNPTESAKMYPTFAHSIYEFANYYVTYGYSEAGTSNPDWRYFGSQNGNKFVGMNVKYASDAYWGEKMASNYYFLDKAYGLQDYNYYQTAVTTQAASAKSAPRVNSKTVFNYKSADNGLVIIGEVEGDSVNGNNKWYKVVSDQNLDANYNPITSGNYNWNSHVYIPAAYVYKTNQGKNGYIAPNDVPGHKDRYYTYDLYTDYDASVNAKVFKPKVAVSIKDTNYYFDPSITSMTGQTLLNNRYVMVFATAYNGNKIPVSYLVTSDYKYDQRHWVSADSIRFVTSAYGQANVTVPNKNTYTIVNPTTEDLLSTHISGLYHYAYTPILEEKVVNNQLWYKVPVSLSTQSNIYGWTLASAENVFIKKSQFTATNQAPVIIASDKTIVQGQSFNALAGVTATDPEDGPITNIEVSGEVKTDTPGAYQITYKVKDKANQEVTKTITITVIADEEPVINATDITIYLGEKEVNLLKNVTATDKEDGQITSITVDDSKVKYTEIGEYLITYKVNDSFGHNVEKIIKLTIKETEPPVINASNKTITINSNFDEKLEVTATDYTGKDITESIVVVRNEVKTNILGTYEVEYKVTDSKNKTNTKIIKVTVTDKLAKEGLYYFDYLKEVNNKLEIKGYHAIKGINHPLTDNFKFYLVIENLQTKTSIEKEVTRITDKLEITRPVFSTDGKDYTYSWFKGTIDIDELSDGDYELYIVTENDKYYAKTQINNKVLKEQVAEFNSTKTATTRNNYRDPSMPLQLVIRSKKISKKTANSVYNQYTQFRTFEGIDNKLHLKGTSYSIGMDLSATKDVKRQIVFENQIDYKTYSYDLGSITDGMYTVGTTLGDNLDKTRAWFDKTIDLSEIPTGKYTIYITTQSNVSDYSELEELLQRDLSKVIIKANSKEYSFKVNMAQRYRVEMTVKEA